MWCQHDDVDVGGHRGVVEDAGGADVKAGDELLACQDIEGSRHHSLEVLAKSLEGHLKRIKG